MKFNNISIRNFFTLTIFILGYFVHSQDIITLKNGNEIEAKVYEISSSEIIYKKPSNLKGPKYRILVGEVFMIKFQNGEKEVFNNEIERKNILEIISDDKSIVKKKGPSTIYFMRKGNPWGSAMSAHFIIYNENRLYRSFYINSGQRIIMTINKAGIYNIKCGTCNSKEFLNVESGESYYVKISPKLIPQHSYSIKTMSSEEGGALFDSMSSRKDKEISF